MRVVQFLIGSYGGAERFFVRLCSALAQRKVEQLLLINDHPALVADVQATGLRYEIFAPSRLGGPVDRYRVFDVERVMVCGDLELIERRGLRPMGLFTMMRFRKLDAGRAAA